MNLEHMQQTVSNTALFDLTHTAAAPLLRTYTWPWEVLPHIGDWVLQYGSELNEEHYDHPAEDVWIAHSAKIFPNTTIIGPCVIGERTEVRPGAFIRGKVFVGDDCVVGNSSELKNVILCDHVEVPHYNYIGDSILGCRSHFGAGALTSNIKSDRQPVVIRAGRFDSELSDISTGITKVGAFVGDGTEIGCQAVLNPGTIIGRQGRIYPLTLVRGFIPAHHLLKQDGTLIKLEAPQ